jgi:glucose/arabinose dehydrogenase
LTATGALFLSARGKKPAMGRVLVHMALMAAAALALAGCGFTDARSPVPEFMRAREPAPPPLEAPPDVKRIVGEKLDSVFTAASLPKQVRVSAPRPDLRGPGWTACVKAETTSVTGKPLGTQTYRITITNGVVSDRRQIEADDNCVSESYEPI